MILRTLDGEQIRGEMTTAFPVSQDGSPILLANDESFSPEEAEFFLESATSKEMEMLKKGGYDLRRGKKRTQFERGAKRLFEIALALKFRGC
jgi:hypothetical protein